VWNNDRVQLVMCVDIMFRVTWSVNITLCYVFFFVVEFVGNGYCFPSSMLM